jgi:hypothetical protein
VPSMSADLLCAADTRPTFMKPRAQKGLHPCASTSSNPNPGEGFVHSRAIRLGASSRSSTDPGPQPAWSGPTSILRTSFHASRSSGRLKATAFSFGVLTQREKRPPDRRDAASGAPKGSHRAGPGLLTQGCVEHTSNRPSFRSALLSSPVPGGSQVISQNSDFPYRVAHATG